MSTYRAIVSITFDEDEMQRFQDAIAKITIGNPWVEQIFVDGTPLLSNSGGLSVAIGPHEE